MKKILLLGLAVLGLFACTPSANPIPEPPYQDSTNQDPPPQPQKQAELAFADIVGANTLYVASGGATGKGTEETNTLFKIDANGSVSAVAFKDKEGSFITPEIDYVRNLSEKYIYLRLLPWPSSVLSKGGGVVDLEGTRDRSSYVVRKTDGATFLCKELAYLDDRTEVQADHDQNVYCILSNFGGQYGRHLCKMYDNNNGVSVMRLSKEYMYVSRYLVNPKGDVLFDSYNQQAETSEYWCYTTSDTFVKSEQEVCEFILKKMPENFYQLKRNRNNYNDASVSLFKLKSTAIEMTSELLIYGLGIDQMSGEGVLKLHSVFACYTQDHVTILLCDIGELILAKPLTPVILRIEGEKSYKLVPLNRTAWPKALKGGLKLSKEYLYGFNTDEIYRISINTGIVETLYANKGYSINSFSIGADDVLIFSALELSKARDVVCEIRGGQLKILQTDDSQKIIQLERIN